MPGPHADGERPLRDQKILETQEEEDRRHREGDARAALENAAHPHAHGRAFEAEANLRSGSTIRAWGAIFGKRGARSGAPGLLLLGLVLVIGALLVAMS